MIRRAVRVLRRHGLAGGLRRARARWLARRTGPRPLHQKPHLPTFTEEDLLARTEEFNQSAERHWQAIAAETAGRGHVLNKPLSTVQDSGAILYRLGLVLSELHLGIGHTVLDFAAGSCWLSSYLNRLRCRTVSVDVSPTALELGRELFRLDPRHRLDLQPQFLAFDGHRLALPAESVDRVVCFDAFHHVPNQDEVLREFFRVLRPGGRAVFAEPGEGHSHADQSLFEMERFGVLENDLHLEDILAKARAAGFTDAHVKPYPDPSTVTFRAEDYLKFMAGRDSLYPLDAVRDSLQHFFVFVLSKGREVLDSRNPGLLQAQITLADPAQALSGPAGSVLGVAFRVKNTGDTLWRHRVDELGGYVMLGGHLYDGSRQPLTRNFVRAALPRDVPPGETVEVRAEIPLPTGLGRYLARFDLVDEWMAWFDQFGSPTPEFVFVVDSYPESTHPHLLRALLTRLDAGAVLVAKPGAPLRVPLQVTNVGDTVWLPSTGAAPGQVALGGHLLQDGRTLEIDLFRVPLPRRVAPQETITLEAAFAAPRAPGRYVVALDLVAESICWFEHRGSPAFPVAVEVLDAVPDSREPGLLRARIEPLTSAPSLHASGGSTVTLRVRVTNSGNTRWLHETRPEGGHVALGGHLEDAEGALLELDLFRAALPRPVEPGESAEVTCQIPVPHTPGRYRVELDMVDEGIAWFGPGGSPTVTLTLLAS